MTTGSRLAYVQARLQARHGRRPTDDRWRLLEATPDLAGYLQAARATSLRPWVVHLPAESGTHQIERSLRRDWKIYVAEISRWLPASWRPAAAWIDTLPELPFFLHLVRGEEVPRWMLEDPLLTEIAQADPEQRRAGGRGLRRGPLHVDPGRAGRLNQIRWRAAPTTHFRGKINGAARPPPAGE